MSNIEIENVVIENVEVKVRVKAKAFAQKDKKTLFSIMAFLKYLEEQGILPDDKTLECLEALPLYKTAAEKTAFFQNDMFDTKVVENELYKPMVSDYKKAKKERKPKEKKEDGVTEDKPKKEKKPREKKQVEKVSIVVEPVSNVVEPVNDVVEPVSNVVEPVSNVVEKVKEKKPKGDSSEPKRGRKPKQQIVELAQDVVQVEEKDPLDVLIQSMNEKEEPTTVPVLEELNVDDVDAMLAELEAEEIVEKKVNTPVLKEKKKKDPEAVAKVAVVKKTKKAKDVVVVDN
jgi:hypothetical protein